MDDCSTIKEVILSSVFDSVHYYSYNRFTEPEVRHWTFVPLQREIYGFKVTEFGGGRTYGLIPDYSITLKGSHHREYSDENLPDSPPVVVEEVHSCRRKCESKVPFSVTRGEWCISGRSLYGVRIIVTGSHKGISSPFYLLFSLHVLWGVHEVTGCRLGVERMFYWWTWETWYSPRCGEHDSTVFVKVSSWVSLRQKARRISVQVETLLVKDGIMTEEILRG